MNNGAFGLSLSFIDSEGNDIPLGSVITKAQIDLDTERDASQPPTSPTKATHVELSLSFATPSYSIFWTMFSGYPALTRYMGAS